jgi:16S rRNA (uracil1498-N3)-methyltransferase
MRRRFFVDRFDGDSATVHGETAEHLGKVLRAEAGQLYELSDGSQVWLGRIARVRKNGGRPEVEFELVQQIEAKASMIRVQLLISIVKFDRFEWCLEKAAELGATDIVPLAASRSEKRLIAAAGKRSQRWAKILVEAAQQARRLRPPTLGVVTPPLTAFSESPAFSKIVLSERPDARSFRSAQMACAGTSVALAIGPEGGWKDEEVASARAAGFLEASLGENILRTETAVVAGLAIIRYALGE